MVEDEGSPGGSDMVVGDCDDDVVGECEMSR